ncbi:MAG: hypothetical protein WBG69_10040 [Arcobacteraceae bacterium]
MHKKLTKYIESYEIIDDEKLYELKPNGGMIVVINHNNSCEIIIEDTLFELKKDQSILINAYTESVEIRSTEKLNLTAVRFKGAAASFFYEDLMEQLMYNPTEPIYLVKTLHDIELDDYFLNRFTPSKLPFNIMKIIDLLDKQGTEYNIDEVLAIANVPRKILDKLFRLHAGLTFKTYAMIKDKS